MSVRNVIQAAAGAGGGDKLYVEDVFSTYLYTGNGSTQTINNGIDLAGEGGLVWIKDRAGTYATQDHQLTDTARGYNSQVQSNSAGGAGSNTTYLTSFNSNGFTLGSSSSVNGTSTSWASWSFRRAPKFFDVVTYTGNGIARTIAHNLGSVPGCIIVKRLDTSGAWRVYHRSLNATYFLGLNETNAAAQASTIWNNTEPTSTVFSVGTSSNMNASGGTYVAYLFAHDSGGFGVAGDQNVISCGSYTGNGSATGPSINLGYEAQWVLIKSSTVAGSHWYLMDTMRNMAHTISGELYTNLNAEEQIQTKTIVPTATGFDVVTTDPYINNSGSTYIYVAIRRGPMKTPTSGTSVFMPVATRDSGTSQSTPIFNAGFPVDLLWTAVRGGSGSYSIPRLTVGQIPIGSSNAEANVYTTYNFGGMIGILSYSGSSLANSGVCGWNFRRAPGFFDVVCYTGTGSAGTTVSHNLGVAPELIITRVRNYAGEDWIAHYRSGTTITAGYLNSTAAFTGSGSAPSTDLSSFTSTTYTLNTSNRRVNSTYNYISFLFASCPGVSKVGTVTVTGTSAINVDCGFTAGARFVLIKRISSTGPWLVWDTSRGIVSGNDPYLGINNALAEDFDGAADLIDPYAQGFTIVYGTFDAMFGTGDFVYLAIA
jgi:hypothetical protein